MNSHYIYNMGLAYYEVARVHESRVALRYPTGETATHGELNIRSNKLARAFLENRVGQGDVVAIFSTKSVDAIASMLACLKIGAIYTNLDVTSPGQRIEKMLETCKPSLILHDSGLDRSNADSSGFRHLSLSDPELVACAHDASDENLKDTSGITGADPAYIMFTSGSTGFPKGAVMSHANLLNFIQWGKATFGITPEDIFTNVNPLYFDNSVFDFYVSLFNGASICPIDAGLTRRGKELIACLDRLGCTVWFSVPSMLIYLLTTKAIGSSDFSAMRSIIFGGEGFPKPKLRELYRMFNPRIELVNVYGPTECTCICSSYNIRDEDFHDLRRLAPLGSLAPNFGYYIDPLDLKEPYIGELLLYGPNVGLGYFGDRLRTQQSFVSDPRGEKFRSVMYRTGDLVKEASDGKLHFLGRVDNQIKHMGYRIELEEIEAAFSTLGDVDEVGVIYRNETGVGGQIIAYIGTKTKLSEKDLLEQVKKIVPPYMLPRKVCFMRELPKNRNGKVDRKKLQELNQ